MTQFEPSLIATDAAERTRFLDALRETGSVVAAASLTGHARTTLRRQRRRDVTFADAWDAVLNKGTTDDLEAALLERATYGVERTRTYADGRVERWREFDNKLAFTLLAKRKPKPYGDAPLEAAAPRPVMTRAEFISAIRMRPRLDAPEENGAAD